MRRRLVALATALALAALPVGPTGAITKDFRADFDHLFVDLVAFCDCRLVDVTDERAVNAWILAFNAHAQRAA